MTGASPLPVAERIISEATLRGVSVATAESLTAGWIAAALADVPGASAVLRGGVVSYHNQVKQEVLGVDESLVEARGSVDAEVARQMAEGARRVCTSDVAVSSTGVAGPEVHDGKAVGTVFIGYASAAGSGSLEFRFTGGRQAIRSQARDAALECLMDLIEEK
ncbi:CinA family protein [Arthrobacter rhombi]|uniref:CinA family protein n=1 Tax=Arthrobacter rhombi TaxID=71253 RepID=UPI003F91C964